MEPLDRCGLGWQLLRRMGRRLELVGGLVPQVDWLCTVGANPRSNRPQPKPESGQPPHLDRTDGTGAVLYI